jgi:hypothetical protein
LALQRVIAAAHQSARSGHLFELRGRDHDACKCLKLAALLFAAPLLSPAQAGPAAVAAPAPASTTAAVAAAPDSGPSAAAAAASARDATFLRAAARACDERCAALTRAHQAVVAVTGS